MNTYYGYTYHLLTERFGSWYISISSGLAHRRTASAIYHRGRWVASLLPRVF